MMLCVSVIDSFYNQVIFQCVDIPQSVYPFTSHKFDFSWVNGVRLLCYRVNLCST